MRAFVLPALGVFAPLVTAAPGAVLVNDFREFTIEASADSDFGGASETSFAFPDGDFTPFSYGDSIQAVGAQSATSAAQGSMSSSVAADAFTFSGMVSGSAQIFDETAYSAGSSGLARFQVGFTLEETSLWRVLATYATSGSADTNIIVSQGHYPGGDVVFAWSSDLGAGVDESVILGPGEYCVLMEARHSISLFGPKLVTASATLNASFTLVPAPGAWGLLAFGALAGARRHRPTRG